MNAPIVDKNAPALDLEALRRKYDFERDRRVRPEGDAQYVKVSGKYATYGAHDPFATEPDTREPVTADIEVAVIGGGWAGLIAGKRLRDYGIDDVHIIEEASDFGGTWYWNRYPGAQCDIESYCYMPLLEETNFVPSLKYAYSEEIFEHAQRIGRMFGLYDGAFFRTRVESAAWDEDSARWIIRTNRNDVLRARFLVNSTGPASRPKLPGIPGLEDFKGEAFHTGRWNYEYTGGGPRGGMTKLADKRVAVIGTGATGVQCIPYLAKDCKHLYVFQRTPAAVDERRQAATDPAWAAGLKPGWARERRENFNDVISGKPFEVDMVSDCWTDLARLVQDYLPLDDDSKDEPSDASPIDWGEIADFEKMNSIRARIDRIVEDKETAELLKPWYRLFCKRPTFNDEYLPTFNRKNVTLVDTSRTHGVERITEKGLVVDGVEYEVDCIIFATGFEISSSWDRRIGFDIRGRNGETVYDRWADGLRTYFGTSVHNFPNWFIIGITQVGASFNYGDIVDDLATHVAYLITQTNARGARTIEATAEAEAEWVATIRENALDNVGYLESCTPGYFNNDGKIRGAKASFSGDYYGPGANAFNKLLADWREEGTMSGFVLQ